MGNSHCTSQDHLEYEIQVKKSLKEWQQLLPLWHEYLPGLPTGESRKYVTVVSRCVAPHLHLDVASRSACQVVNVDKLRRLLEEERKLDESGVRPALRERLLKLSHQLQEYPAHCYSKSPKMCYGGCDSCYVQFQTLETSLSKCFMSEWPNVEVFARELQARQKRHMQQELIKLNLGGFCGIISDHEIDQLKTLDEVQALYLKALDRKRRFAQSLDPPPDDVEGATN